jgi:hypothetical protein
MTTTTESGAPKIPEAVQEYWRDAYSPDWQPNWMGWLLYSPSLDEWYYRMAALGETWLPRDGDRMTIDRYGSIERQCGRRGVCLGLDDFWRAAQIEADLRVAARREEDELWSAYREALRSGGETIMRDREQTADLKGAS